MQFLDAIGLAYFWEKIKGWANSCFFSNEGGEINPGEGLSYVINGEHLGITTRGSENETINIFDVDENGMEVISIKKSGGTATQVLMADGSVRTLNTSYGIAGLDANGNVPLANLGNLDTTVAEVVTALPTSNIKRHIYLVKDSDTTNNKYAEYVYTGDISAAYDSTKWEKLGDFRATVDLADYAKKSEAVNKASCELDDDVIRFQFKNINDEFITGFAISSASSTKAGAMSADDKSKLNRLDISGIDVTDAISIGSLITADGRLVVDSSDNSISVTLPSLSGLFNLDFSLSAATSAKAGVMTAADKTKLDGIASGATADSAITTAEIDALFA